ncbi:DUF3226 domain-containing protein [Desulfatibacillum aliphaticivorans]|uniref:DUF3226 domain-containing protein n=1 Tax=Desulfatibacillum aliphaticivorans TaxID=218208 RepID=UPI00041E4987|nr:DUF3226 domain-containing protein [Desulfatibacillum aliphaticivorans]
MKKMLEIKTPKALLVEGQDAWSFFRAMIVHLKLEEEVRAYNFGGIKDFRKYLNTFKDLPGFWELETLAIIRDAEVNASDAFKSIQGALEQCQLPIPTAPATFLQAKPKIGVFILPDQVNPGMLETLCLRAVTDDPGYLCLDSFFDCFKDNGGEAPNNMEKAKVQAFLATRKKPGRLIGQSADQGHWPWDNEAFSEIIGFVQSM